MGACLKFRLPQNFNRELCKSICDFITASLGHTISLSAFCRFAEAIKRYERISESDYMLIKRAFPFWEAASIDPNPQHFFLEKINWFVVSQPNLCYLFHSQMSSPFKMKSSIIALIAAAALTATAQAAPIGLPRGDSVHAVTSSLFC